MNPTHKKRPYLAAAVQWRGHNLPEVISQLDNAELQRGKYIVIRHANGVDTLKVGDWIVRGENGSVKTYTNEVFWTKYQKLGLFYRIWEGFIKRLISLAREFLYHDTFKL